MSSAVGYVCRCCGKHHQELPLAYRTQAPEYWSDELAGHPDSALSDDQCIVRGEHFFVQGNVEIPIIGRDEVFAWGVWVSLSEASFERISSLWHQPGRESEPPYFGWLSTELPIYPPGTLQLKTHVHTQPVGRRPLIELEPTDHPLAVEQRNGITWERVQEIAELVMHPPSERS